MANEYPFFSSNRINFFRVCEEEERKARVGGRYWENYKGDKDKWPSDPQAIDTEYAEKLDLDNGDVYCVRTKALLRRISRRDLRRSPAAVASLNSYTAARSSRGRTGLGNRNRSRSSGRLRSPCTMVSYDWWP